MTDLAEIKPVVRTIEIRHPGTSRPLGVRVSLASLDDERLAKVRRSIQDKRLYLEQRGKTFKSEEIEANRLTILTTAITGWEWYSPTDDDADMPQFEGEVPDFNRGDVREVLTTLTWFGDQINEALGETESFFAT